MTRGEENIHEENCVACLRSRCERRGAADVSASDMMAKKVNARRSTRAQGRDTVAYAFVTLNHVVCHVDHCAPSWREVSIPRMGMYYSYILSTSPI